MKKVIILTNEFFPFKGGIGRYCEEVINASKNKYNITLVAPKYNGSLTNQKIAEGIILNLFDGGQFKYWDFPKLIKKVMSIDFSCYDYVLVADWPFWVAIEFVNKFIPRKKISFNLMLHGSEILNLRNGKASIFSKLLNMFDQIESIYTNSEYTKRILLSNHSVPIGIPIEVTYLGVSQQANNANKKYCERYLSENFSLLSVGRLDDRKGYDYAIKAISLLEDSVKEKITYTIVGNGTQSYKEHLINLARNNNVKLEILSGLDDKQLENTYAEANLFLLTAKENNKKIEGFGLVFLEAAKNGVPSLATDVGAISEVVINGITGIVVPENIINISEAILKCYNNRDSLLYYSNNCISYVQDFTWEKLVDKTFIKLEK